MTNHSASFVFTCFQFIKLEIEHILSASIWWYKNRYHIA